MIVIGVPGSAEVGAKPVMMGALSPGSFSSPSSHEVISWETMAINAKAISFQKLEIVFIRLVVNSAKRKDPLFKKIVYVSLAIKLPTV